MFGFDQPEDGSEDRYKDRWALWEGMKLGAVRHYTWWLVHNLVAHPLIAVAPIRPAFRFHDWTSHRMHAKRDK